MAYEEQLQVTGLTLDQAKLYEALVKKGPQPASKLAREAGVSRTLSYKVLAELQEKGLVTRNDVDGAISTFTPAHPLQLNALVEEQNKRAQTAVDTARTLIDRLTSDYNLASGKPGVRFYEGLEGVRAVVNDALTSKTEIYSYVDIDAVEQLIPDISRDFAKARRKLGLKKKNIGIDTPENRMAIEGYYTDITEEILIPWPTEKFGTVMQIYDGKVSYITLEGQMIGVIIADPHIYQMHRSLFESTWLHPHAYRPWEV